MFVCVFVEDPCPVKPFMRLQETSKWEGTRKSARFDHLHTQKIYYNLVYYTPEKGGDESQPS